MMNSYRVKLSRHYADGFTLKPIKYFAFGDGGHDANNQATLPDKTAIALNNELLRKQVVSHVFEDAFSCTFSGVIDVTEIVGGVISEIGLLDELGELVAEN